MKILSILMVLFVAGGVEASNFTRYQVILDQQPFGNMAAIRQKAQKPAPVVATRRSFIKDLKMYAITETDTGIRVGFMNVRKKPAKTYYLGVGDNQDGIEVVSADYKNGVVVLKQGDDQQELRIAGEAPSVINKKAVKKNNVLSALKPRGVKLSYRDRLKLKREADAAKKRESNQPPLPDEAKKLSPPELEKELREYNINLIREGKKALPIKLTVEEDNMLVDEGFLPAE